MNDLKFSTFIAMNSPRYVLMKLLPKNLESRLFGNLINLKIPFLSKLARNLFAHAYALDMSEASRPLDSYANIGELFVRELLPGKRPVAESEVVSPVDGRESQTGSLEGPDAEMIQAKGKTYSLSSLLRDAELASRFSGGRFATIYLAPFNYHRIHSPVKGRLLSASYCPGTLWPVNPWSVERVEGLFCINERLTTRIAVDGGGELLLVKVGATNVGRIVVNYAPNWITNVGKLPRTSPRLDFSPKEEVRFEKGEEIGRFEMGSTVILVADRVLSERNPGLFASSLGKPVRMGQSLV